MWKFDICCYAFLYWIFLREFNYPLETQYLKLYMIWLEAGAKPYKIPKIWKKSYIGRPLNVKLLPISLEIRSESFKILKTRWLYSWSINTHCKNLNIKSQLISNSQEQKIRRNSHMGHYTQKWTYIEYFMARISTTQGKPELQLI